MPLNWNLGHVLSHIGKYSSNLFTMYGSRRYLFGLTLSVNCIKSLSFMQLPLEYTLHVLDRISLKSPLAGMFQRYSPGTSNLFCTDAVISAQAIFVILSVSCIISDMPLRSSCNPLPMLDHCYFYYGWFPVTISIQEFQNSTPKIPLVQKTNKN